MEISPIGKVSRNDSSVVLAIDEEFASGLKQLEHFSHVMVLWWADRTDDPESRRTLTCRPPYAEEHLTGVFACRAEYRPNPIAVTTCRIEEVDEDRGEVVVQDIDALDGSPILDLKAYFPVLDRVREAHIPGWLEGWPEWMPEEGIGLYEE
jgi:tRNA-Thr(GGU) m(6)t(6)A37 methyltransferase TsaA